MSDLDPTGRFSCRVDDYIAARPSYPAGVFHLAQKLGLNHNSVIADIGSGTGILTRVLVHAVETIYAVEPNREMAAAAERQLQHCSAFCSVSARAEATGLPDASVDMIVAGQAFHWFDPAAVAIEFRRILRPGGVVLLISNSRSLAETPFLAAYEEFLNTWSVDYEQVKRRYDEQEALRTLFGTADFHMEVFPNSQNLDERGLAARIRSCSYMPGAEHPQYTAMMAALARLFAIHQRDGQVRIDYRTQVLYNELV